MELMCVPKLKFNYSMYNLRMIRKQTEDFFTWDYMSQVQDKAYTYSAVFTDKTDGAKYKVTIEPVD